MARPGRAAIVAAALAVVVVGACDPDLGRATAAPTPTAPASASPSFVRPTPTPFPTPVEYIVHTGDSLTTIARRFATTPRSIALWNRDRYPSLDPDAAGYAPDRIGVGWRLVVVPNVTYEEAAEASADASSAGAPSAEPTPSLAVPPGPTPRSDGVAVFVARGSSAVPAIALTFELRSGDRAAIAAASGVVELLAARRNAATIFVDPSVPATDTGLAFVGRLDPNSTAIGIGGWGGTSRLATAEAAASAAGRTTRPWYRPGTDSPPPSELAAVGGRGWAYAIGWDVDATGLGSGADVAARVLSRVTGGSIVRLVLDDPSVVAALPEILDGLESRGLVPLTIPRLLGR